MGLFNQFPASTIPRSRRHLATMPPPPITPRQCGGALSLLRLQLVLFTSFHSFSLSFTLSCSSSHLFSLFLLLRVCSPKQTSLFIVSTNLTPSCHRHRHHIATRPAEVVPEREERAPLLVVISELRGERRARRERVPQRELWAPGF